MRAMEAREDTFGFISSFLDLNTISAKRQKMYASKAAEQNHISTANAKTKDYNTKSCAYIIRRRKRLMRRLLAAFCGWRTNNLFQDVL
jgi:hypothetical protein